MDSVFIDSGQTLNFSGVILPDENIQLINQEVISEPSFDNPVMPMPLDVCSSQFPSLDSQFPPMDHEKPRKRKQAAPQQVKCDDPETSSSSKKHSTTAETEGSEGASNSKMLPIHCEVEFCKLPDCEKDEASRMGKDGYAIVPSNLKLQDLIQTALTKLEYQASLAKFSEGLILIRNWKPLPFTSITERLDITVGDLFSDLLSQITLKIRVGVSCTPSSSNNPSVIRIPQVPTSRSSDLPCSSVVEIRKRLMQLLEKRGSTLLVSHGCPFSQMTTTAILQGRFNKPISPQRLQAFYRWYNTYISLTDNTLVPPEYLDSTNIVKTSNKILYRGRTLFNAKTEIPQLMKWYRQNPRPSRSTLERYVAELNSSEYRRNGNPLQYSSVAIWFKNARVKYKSYCKDFFEDFKENQENQDNEVDDDSLQVDEMNDKSCEEGYDDISHLSNDEEDDGGSNSMFRNNKNPSPVNALNLSNHIVPSTLIPVSGSMQHPSDPSPVLLVPAASAAQFPNAQILAPIPPHMMMSAQLQQNMAAFPRHPLVGQSPIGMQPQLMVGQTPIGVQPQFTPYVDMSRMTLNHQNHRGQQTTLINTPRFKVSGNSNGVSYSISGHPSSAGGGDSDEPHENGKPGLSDEEDVEFQDLSHFSESSTVVTPTYVKVSQKQPRKRFNIDYAHDLPKLQQWFEENPRPDRDTIERYVEELNASEFRQHQEKYNPRVVYVWFKNARAKVLRGQKLSQRWQQIMGTGSHPENAEQTYQGTEEDGVDGVPSDGAYQEVVQHDMAYPEVEQNEGEEEEDEAGSRLTIIKTEPDF